MTTRTYAAWVEPIAERFQKQRAELVELVYAIPEAAWQKDSPNAGWTYRDLLGHVATRDPHTMRIVLNAVIATEPIDPAQLRPEEEAPLNDQLRSALRGQSTDQIVAGIDIDTEGILALLAKLRDEDEHLRQQEFPMDLGEALRLMPQHERMHMEQLRAALEDGS